MSPLKIISAFALVTAAAWTVGCDNAASNANGARTARATAPSITASAESRPQSTPSVRLRLGKMGPPVTRALAPAVGRTDCPADWYAYTGGASQLSLCYGPDWTLDISSETSDGGKAYGFLTWSTGPVDASGESPGSRTRYNLSDDVTGAFVSVGLIALPSSTDGAAASLVSAFCDAFPKSADGAHSTGEIRIDGLNGSYCKLHDDVIATGMESTVGILSLPGEKFLEFNAYARSGDAVIDDAIAAILKTAVVR